MKRVTSIFKLAKTISFAFILVFSFKMAGGQKAPGKVSPDLLELTESKAASKALPALKKTGPSQNLTQSDLAIRSADGSMILIEAIAEKSSSELLKDLKSIGLKEGEKFGRKVSGFLPSSSVVELSSVKSLRYVTPVYKPILNSGPAVTQGDPALKSDVIRSQYGLEGVGIKVGILSDSYNSLGGAPDGVATGELPGADNPNGYTSEVEVLADIEDGSDEGRAMAEIVHDIAPAAELAFYSAYIGDVEFAQGIIDLANAGCQVITDDISYLNEPFFQDGIIAQAVDYVVEEMGVAYYSSAGNADRDSYQSEFRDGGTYLIANPYDGVLLGEYVMHDFDPGEDIDIWQEVTFYGQSTLQLAFQWDDPFASVCETCPGAETDMDIFLALSPDTFDVILQSINYNIDADAWEILSAGYSADDTLTAYVAFGKWNEAPGPNPNPNLVKYISYGDVSPTEYALDAPTTMGHSNSEFGVSVGAAFWFRTPYLGYDPPQINSYSSAGGIPILFDTKGKRFKKPELRMNPLFTATDGGNTSFFGQLLNDGDDFPNFFGTSASAPHAAAVTAQLMQMADGALSEEEINDILSNTTLDMDDPFTEGFDAGYDLKSGYGLIQADAAALEVFKRVGIKNITPHAECSENPAETRRWRIHNPNSFAVEVGWEVIDTDQEGTFIASPGDSYLETDTREWYNLLMVSFDGPWGGTRKIVAYSPGETCSSVKNAITNAVTFNSIPTLVIGAYPNPVVNTLNLDIYNGSESGLMIRIYNLQGSEVYQNELTPAAEFSTVQLDLSELRSGMYILKTFNNEGNLIEDYKIVKQ